MRIWTYIMNTYQNSILKTIMTVTLFTELSHNNILSITLQSLFEVFEFRDLLQFSAMKYWKFSSFSRPFCLTQRKNFAIFGRFSIVSCISFACYSFLARPHFQFFNIWYHEILYNIQLRFYDLIDKYINKNGPLSSVAITSSDHWLR